MNNLEIARERLKLVLENQILDLSDIKISDNFLKELINKLIDLMSDQLVIDINQLDDVEMQIFFGGTILANYFLGNIYE